MNWLRPTTKSESALRPFGEINRLFNHFFGPDWGVEWPAPAAESWFPAMNVEETQEAWLLSFDLPGVDPKHVQITVDQNELTIRGEVATGGEAPTGTAHRRERRVGSFVRTLTLPTNVDTTKIAANSKNGVLYLSLPKSEASKPRTIKVEPS